MAIVGAVFTLWAELLAATLVGGEAMRFDRGLVGPPDLVLVPIVGALLVLLVRRIVQPSMLGVHLVRGGRMKYPSTSWAHATADSLYATGGVAMLRASSLVPGDGYDPLFGMGLGWTIVPGALLVLRLVFLRRALAM